jgi:hypothetical protein
MRGALLVTLLACSPPAGRTATSRNPLGKAHSSPTDAVATGRQHGAARGLALDTARATGKVGKEYAKNPLPRTVAFRRGRERCDICRPVTTAPAPAPAIVERG